jgi:vancomycin resistance protein VanJ
MLRRKLGQLVDLYLTAIAGWALAWRVLRDAWGGLALVNAWAFWLITPALPVGAWRLRRSKWLAGVWVAGGLVLLLERYGHAFNWQSQNREPPARLESGNGIAAGPAGVTAMRVMSMNVLRDNCNAPAIAAAIQGEAPDLVVVQELQPAIHRYLEAALADYEHRHWQPHLRTGGGLGVFSRHALEPTGLWSVGDMRPFAMRVTLNMPAGKLDVYDVHLISAGPDALRRTGLTGNFRERERQIQVLLDEVTARRNPAMLLGDHNMTEGNEAYRLMTSQLTDAWRVAGRGPGWTWPRSMESFDAPARPTFPVLRLDYCFCTPSIEPQSMHVIYESVGSDHCPIVVDTLLHS